MEVSTPKTEGKLHKLKNITMTPYHFIWTLLNANFDFGISVANDVAIDVARFALPGQGDAAINLPGSVHFITNENGCYIMK